MRSVFVVNRFPFFGHFPNLVQGREEMGIEYFVPVALVEPFDKRILIWLTRLDVADLCTVFFTPVHKGLGAELGAIVAADGGGPAP